MATPSPTELPDISIQYNLVETLDSEDLQRIRNAVFEEVNRIFCSTEQHSDSEASVLPFGEKIIESKEEKEPRMLTMIKQLQTSVRYIDEMLALDTEICGLEEGHRKQDSTAQNYARTAGIKMPLSQIKQRGKSATIVTQNSWGSTDYSDKTLQNELCTVFKNISDNNDEQYEKTLSDFLQYEPNTEYDVQILSEDDRVDIFNGDNEYIGAATVREARGNIVQLHISGKVRLHKDCYLRKKSNRKALESYKQYVYTYCNRLGITDRVTDRRGDPCQWNVHQNVLGGKKALSPAEEVFFGINQGPNGEQQESRHFEAQSIPRSLLTDNEQSVAFSLGAMGHPCYLIQGPPGTGKTMVASHLVNYLRKHNVKTLICSHSNRGLDVLLAAIKKRGADVYRGGTEIGVCAKTLRDDFIRKDLKAPQMHDFMTKRLKGNGKKWWDAVRIYESEGGPCPELEHFQKDVVDTHALQLAWEHFHYEKDKLIKHLSEQEDLVAGVTLNSLLSDEIIDSLDFDVVIVDEASRGYIFELLPALQKAGKQIIFIGDHKQLSNITLPKHLISYMEDQPSEEGDEEKKNISEEDVTDFEKGPFEFMAERTSIHQVMLRTNRRSLPGIVDMISLARYGGKLMAGKYDKQNPSNPGVMTWVDTRNRPDRLERQMGVSKGNDLEARLVARRIIKQYLQGELTDENFGVISMYSGQRNLIIQKIRKHPFQYDYQRDDLLKLMHGNHGTVDSFQGTERKQIFCSITSSNEDGNIGHTKDIDRINVASSRAQEVFTMTADSSTIIDNNPDSESAAYYAILKECIAKHGQIIDTFPELAAEAIAEEEKSQTYNAKRNRRRRARRKTT